MAFTPHPVNSVRLPWEWDGRSYKNKVAWDYLSLVQKIAHKQRFTWESAYLLHYICILYIKPPTLKRRFIYWWSNGKR